MRKGVYLLIGLIVGFVITPITRYQKAMAQVPSGVVVDSIGPVTAAATWRSESPFRSHHLVATPKTGEMVFIEGQNQSNGTTNGGASLDPAWYYSSDNGTTWSVNLSPFTNDSSAGQVAVAADTNGNIYVAFDRLDSLYFNEDAIVHDGTTLGSDVLVNAPGGNAQCPDIAVSPDGQHIIIIAQVTHGDYDSLDAYYSTDGGSTWGHSVALTTSDPSIAPRAYSGSPTFQWDCKSFSMGSNGYAFAAVRADYDSTFTGAGDHWNLISETTDYGATWTPSWVTPPSTNGWKPTGNAWDYDGPAIAVGSTPHLASIVTDQNGVQVLIDSHKEGGVWVHHAISRPDSTKSLSYEIPRDGGLGLDTQGRLYCVWTDQNLSVSGTSPAYQIFMSGSSDGGDTWTQPIRLTDTQPFCSGNEVLNSPQIPALMGSTSAAMAINGAIFSLFPGQNPPTAWVEAQFPLSVVWNGTFDQDAASRLLKANGYSETHGTSGYNWIDISKTGIEIDTLLHNIPNGSVNTDDGTAGKFPLGFSFNLYSVAYDSFEVSANGFISFTDTTFGWPPPAFPANTFRTIIAPLASDPSNDQGNDTLFYWTNAAKDTSIIEWYHCTDWNSGATDLTYEIILAKNDSSITYQYAGAGPNASAYHVVLQGGVGDGFNFNALGFIPDSGMVIHMQPGNGTGVKGSPQPLTYALNQNYPNPFNPSTQIDYTLAKNSYVTLKVYNVLGQEVATVFSGNQIAGDHSVTFDAARYSSGVYFYRIRAGNFSSVKKMVLMK